MRVPRWGLRRAFGSDDLKAAVHIGQGGGGGIGDGCHISNTDVMAAMGDDLIHGTFEGCGAAEHWPAVGVSAVDGAEKIGLFGVKSTRKAASQRACPFRQNINAKYPIAPHRQTDPAVGSQTDQNGGRVGRERGKSADGCARASISALSGDDRDRLRHMAHRLNE